MPNRSGGSLQLSALASASWVSLNQIGLGIAGSPAPRHSASVFQETRVMSALADGA